MFFRKKKKEPTPDVAFTYPQSEHYRGFKRIKLSSYGYKPAEDGIRALTGKDLAGSDVKLSIYMDDSPRAMVSVNGTTVGTIWKHSFDKFTTLKNGKIAAVRVEIRDGESYLFYKA